jgi:hypothetical protein
MRTDAACSPRTDAPPLTASTVPVSAIDARRREQMFALFARYYDCVGPDRFAADLAAKDSAILLTSGERLAGFTTMRTFDFAFAGETVGVVFSGDTIVDRAFWGEQVMARAWLAEIGRLARANAGKRLFWFLIVKGHRTYRYLPAFARRYLPARQPADEVRGLRDALGSALFGPAFDPATGVVRFETSAGQLATPWAEPAPRERSLPDVAFFLQANPGYAQGDELACLCDLSRANMRPRARRWFDAGFDAA